MPEIPTIQNTDEKSEIVRHNAEEIINNPAKMNAFFTYAETQVAPTSQAERWDLHEPAVAFDPETTQIETSPYTATPEYAAAPKSRAQEIEETLFYRNNAELVKYARLNTQGVIALRHAA